MNLTEEFLTSIANGGTRAVILYTLLHNMLKETESKKPVESKNPKKEIKSMGYTMINKIEEVINEERDTLNLNSEDESYLFKIFREPLIKIINEYSSAK